MWKVLFWKKDLHFFRKKTDFEAKIMFVKSALHDLIENIIYWELDIHVIYFEKAVGIVLLSQNFFLQPTYDSFARLFQTPVHII